MSTSPILSQCQEALNSANVQAFLRLIREGESAQTEDAYRWLFGSTRRAPKLFEKFDDHPRVKTFETYDGQFIRNGKLDYTTAAGAYQITATTWDTNIQRALSLPDFSPLMQDVAAVYLMRFRRALDDVLAGRIVEAIRKLQQEWASMPGAAAGDQPTQALGAALAVYAKYGGLVASQMGQQVTTAPQATPARDPMPTGPIAAPAGPIETMPAGESPDWPPQEKRMPLPLIIGALLPSLIEAIPKLGKLFGSGSAVAERNVRAAELAVQIVQEATGARNAQEAVETIKADPVAQQTAAKAIESRWLELDEAGGGGIEGARKADAATRAPGESVWKSPSLIVCCLLLPLVYLIMGNVTGLYGAEWAPEARAGIAGSIAGGIVMGLIGYYYGQTTSRNRTTS